MDNMRENINVIATITEVPKEKISFCDYAQEALFMVSRSHYWHLTTRSYASHKALNEFYDELQELVDTVIEAYIGEHGELILQDRPFYFDATENAIPVINDFHDKTEALVTVFNEFTSLTNPLEDILTLCKQTVYKLEYLI